MRRGTPDLILDTVWQPSCDVLILDSGQDAQSEGLVRVGKSGKANELEKSRA